MNKYREIQQAAYEANMKLPELGLVLFTFGNVSAADRSLGVFAISQALCLTKIFHRKKWDRQLRVKT